MKRFFIVAFILITFCNHGQDTQKKFRYAIVPLQYTFTSEPNQFQLNVLTRVMLQEEGFEVYMSEGEEIPERVAENQCLSLKAKVIKDKGLFTTNLRFQLINCYGNLVYESVGSSREKSYKDAYQEALKEAIAEFQSVSYKYVQKDFKEEQETIVEVDTTNENLPFEKRASLYTIAENSYWLVKNNEDYFLYLDKGETVFATLKLADIGTYAYDSDKIDGAAYFTAEGDLVVEYLDKNKDAVQKLVYKKQ